MHQVPALIAKYKYAGIFVSIGLGIVGLPIPDETILAFVGFQVYQGKLHALPAFLSCFAGTTCGISIEYLIGRFLGTSIIERHSSRFHLRQEHIAGARSWYERYGKFSLSIGYFIPGVRHVLAIAVGPLSTYRTFALYAYTGGFVWVSCFMLFGYIMAEEWHRALEFSQRHIIPVAVSGILLIALIGLAVALYRKREGS